MMKLRCPKCGRPCGIAERVCACGFCFTLAGAVKHYLQKLKRAGVVQCPVCKEMFPVGTAACPNGHVLTVDSATDAVVEKPKKSFVRFCVEASPRTKRTIQWIHLLLSALLLFSLLSAVPSHYRNGWAAIAVVYAVSAVYVSASFLLLKLIVPAKVFGLLLMISWRVKLSLLFHGFSGILLVHILVVEWWSRAVVFAFLLALSVGSALLFSKVGLPFFNSMRDAFVGNSSRPFDPRAPQGRNVRVE